MRTFNKKGDSGETSLLHGTRVPKSNPRCEAYGTIDEAVSALGLARQFCQPRVTDIIASLQRDLFAVGAELATPDEHQSKPTEKQRVTPEMTQRLEHLIDELESEITMPKAFIIPGETSVGSAALDLARAIIRRAERKVVSLKQAGISVNDEIGKYLNRSADLVFTLARCQEMEDKK